MKKSFYRQWIMLSLTPMILWCSCTKRIYVPVETVRIVRDSSLRVAARADTLLIRDSISERSVGDTLVREAWHTRLVSRQMRDTVVRILRDTVSVEKPVVIQAEKSAASSSRSRRWLWTALLSLLPFILYIAWRKLRR